ncbi:MAG: hypothetical protein PHW31_03445 [Candidatus Pacebacteria bacterium]|nr:hypothetical protein [Candidatus Paceibacterota bacterium]
MAQAIAKNPVKSSQIGYCLLAIHGPILAYCQKIDKFPAKSLHNVIMHLSN